MIAMRRWIVLASAGAAAVWAAMAAAEQSKPESAPASAMEGSVAKFDCPRPKLPERIVAADEAARFTKQMDAYTACATRYVDERRAQARRYGDLARQEADAANAAVKEINDVYANARQLSQRSKN